MCWGGRLEWVVIDHATVVIDNAPAGDAPSSNIVWVVANANDQLVHRLHRVRSGSPRRGRLRGPPHRDHVVERGEGNRTRVRYLRYQNDMLAVWEWYGLLYLLNTTGE